MDNREHERENNERRNSNTEYLPTKCRITKPPPPKPAANPMQFVKIAPCPLFQRAQEQIRKVEEVKRERKEVREETEDWQLNLDNWKSSRRKRQEHIIERVVEVKKLEQEEMGKGRRKSKTFSEMMGDRRHKISIPIYDDDSNDLSDYGIGSSSSKTNSIKDVDTDDSNSILDEKEHSFNTSNQSEDEVTKEDTKNNNNSNKPAEQYTYEGAIQDYRYRIQSKIHVDESIFTKNKTEAQTVLPKGEIFKRRELFEGDKNVEINAYESNTSRRLSEDFANTRSIKDRLKSLGQSMDQSQKNVDTNDIQVSVKQRLENFNKQQEVQNINKPKPNKISNFLIDKSNSTPSFQSKPEEPTDRRCSSPETELFVNNLNMFDKELDFMNGKNNSSIENGMDEFYNITNYPPSTSSVELTGILSDREDSGIHTADVSCAVSQADEPIDTDSEITTNTIPSCIEKLAKETEKIQLETYTKEDLDITKQLLDDLRRDSSENQAAERQSISNSNKIEEVETTETIEPEMDYFMTDSTFTMSTTLKEPPKVKPPPPPPEEETFEEKPVKRMNSTKRIKKEIHLKRSSFLGLDEPTDDQLEPNIGLEKPPDISSYLQKESKLEKSLYKKIHEDRPTEGSLSKVESQDSGLDIDRGRLSSDTWCSSVGHERQDSEQTNSITSDEDEITKKEREIIELIEKEEKSRDPIVDCVANNFKPSNNETVVLEPSLGSDQFKNPYFPQQSSDFDDRDSEVLKVEHELRQLEKEELERQRENLLFQESRAKARLQNNRHSLENICDELHPNIDYRKSMPELPHIPLEYRTSVPEVPNTYHNISDYRKSMPDIQQHVYQNITPDHFFNNNNRKSMPELQPIKAGAPIKPDQTKPRPLMTKHNLQALSAAPRSRHNDTWIQQKPKTEKSYNQHWLIQEAELRRINEMKKMPYANRNLPQSRNDKHLPDSIIQSLTQRVQNRTNINERNPQQIRRPDQSPNRKEFMQHPYMGNPQTMGHAMPMSYAPPINVEETQDRMLSVSGKKKCSYCGHELGRGAAMIIESLCLFYHMECFKCCVCHMQLGDGRMGTDVRVRNQKLHCQNCYSSDDGIKFSCV